MSASLAHRAPPYSGRTDTARTAETGASALTSFDVLRRHYELGPEEKWQIPVVQKLVEFANFPTGWDSYNAPPMKWDAGMFALNVLSRVMLSRTPLPDVVPTPTGGVQVEWHTGGIDLEFHVAGPYDCELWFEDQRTGKTVSEVVTDDLSDLQDALRTLTKR
jgi:hypothetical protein